MTDEHSSTASKYSSYTSSYHIASGTSGPAYLVLIPSHEGQKKKSEEGRVTPVMGHSRQSITGIVLFVDIFPDNN